MTVDMGRSIRRTVWFLDTARPTRRLCAIGAAAVASLPGAVAGMSHREGLASLEVTCVAADGDLVAGVVDSLSDLCDPRIGKVRVMVCDAGHAGAAAVLESAVAGADAVMAWDVAALASSTEIASVLARQAAGGCVVAASLGRPDTALAREWQSALGPSWSIVSEFDIRGASFVHGQSNGRAPDVIAEVCGGPGDGPVDFLVGSGLSLDRTVAVFPAALGDRP